MKGIKRLLVALLFLSNGVSGFAVNDVFLNIHGRLSDRTGAPVTTPQPVELRLYRGGSATVVESGTPVYKELTTISPAAGGIFDYKMGTGTPIEGHELVMDDLRTQDPTYVLLIVDGFALLPKMELSTIHKSYIATYAETVKDDSVNTNSILNGTIRNSDIAADAQIEHSKLSLDPARTLTTTAEKTKFNELIGGGVTTLHSHPLLEMPFGGVYIQLVMTAGGCPANQNNFYTNTTSCPNGFSPFLVREETCGVAGGGRRRHYLCTK